MPSYRRSSAHVRIGFGSSRLRCPAADWGVSLEGLRENAGFVSILGDERNGITPWMSDTIDPYGTERPLMSDVESIEIVTTSDVLHGQPRIEGTRIGVFVIGESIREGE